MNHITIMIHINSYEKNIKYFAVTLNPTISLGLPIPGAVGVKVLVQRPTSDITLPISGVKLTTIQSQAWHLNPLSQPHIKGRPSYTCAQSPLSWPTSV